MLTSEIVAKEIELYIKQQDQLTRYARSILPERLLSFLSFLSSSPSYNPQEQRKDTLVAFVLIWTGLYALILADSQSRLCTGEHVGLYGPFFSSDNYRSRKEGGYTSQLDQAANVTKARVEEEGKEVEAGVEPLFAASSRGHFWSERYAAGLVGIDRGLETYESTGSAGTTQGYGYGTEMEARECWINRRYFLCREHQ
ncbi:unnamed protein product [Ilex paraguariensis]|uniref:Uncharacterized protein n=1 Tax=Ilex paraguariensis TaxID=185542 RepID=A0ABC8UL18_9AQUA